MGVTDLWKLLSASGRTIDVNSLKGIRVAIDVSIWMIRILHGMSNAGVNFQNVHLIGMLKRIMYLLQLGMKPVFVFDGPPPELKRQTLNNRAHQRQIQNRNLQKIAERYIVKLVERGFNIEDHTLEESEQQIFDEEIEPELPPEELEVLHQQEQEILNLQFDQLKTMQESSCYENFYDLDIESKKQIIQDLLEQKGTAYVEDQTVQLKRFLARANFNERIREIQREAKKQIEAIRIEKILDQNDDNESKLIKEYMWKNEDLVLKIGSFGINNVYLYLQDHESRKELVNLLQANKKKKRKQRLKDYQIEDQHLKRVRETIKQRYQNKYEEQEELEKQESEEEAENLIDKYNIFDIDLLAEQLLQNENQLPDNSQKIYQTDQNMIVINQNNNKYEIGYQNNININQGQNQKQNNQSIKVNSAIEYKNDNDNNNNNNYYTLEQEQQQKQEQESESQSLSQSQQLSKSQPDVNYQQNNIFRRVDSIPVQESVHIQQNQRNGQDNLNHYIEIPFEKDKTNQTQIPQSSEISQKQFQRKDVKSKESQQQSEQQQQQEIIDQFLTQIDDIDDNLTTGEMLQKLKAAANIQSLDFGSLQNKFEEVRYLLSLFGIPWIIAPGEAEAQCAFLQQNNLVDCVITEDSDVFLFGATKVLKGLFQKESNLHFYDSSLIKEDLGLRREQLIFLALFLGSDYTLGIKGVGIVNAMEIVEIFDSIEGLKRFSEWASKADILLGDLQTHYENIPEKERHYKELHKNYKKYWELPDDFPSMEVIEGYLKPKVDESLEEFSWGKPAVDKIVEFCQAQLQYSDEKIDDLIKQPFLRIEQKSDQTKITDYFKVQSKIAIIKSRRLNSVVQNLNSVDISRNNIQKKSRRKALSKTFNKNKTNKQFDDNKDDNDNEINLDEFKFSKQQKK